MGVFGYEPPAELLIDQQPGTRPDYNHVPATCPVCRALYTFRVTDPDGWRGCCPEHRATNKAAAVVMRRPAGKLPLFD